MLKIIKILLNPIFQKKIRPRKNQYANGKTNAKYEINE